VRLLPPDVTFTGLTGRPLVARRYLGAWLVLLATLPLGLYRYYDNPDIGLFTWAVGESTSGAYMGINYHVYHVAAERAVAGEPFYGVAPEPATGNFVYLYPPITVTGFVPFSPLDWTTGYLAFTFLSFAGGLAATGVVVRYVESLGAPLGWVDVALVGALFVLSIHVSATVYFGNINILLGLAFAVGFWALVTDRGITAGVAFAVAALFKLFPALVGLWLLRDGRLRAVAAAVGTGVAGILAGLALFGVGTTERFFTSVISGRSDASLFVGGLPVDSPFYVTVQRPLSHLIWTVWPKAPYVVLPAATALVCGGVLAVFYRQVQTQRERLMAVFATVVVTLVIVPSFRLYAPIVFPPLVALLYTWTGGPGRRLFILGALLFSVVTRPRHVLTAAEYLGGLSGPVTAIGTVATVQLYAYGVMLVACVWHCRSSPGEGTASVTAAVLAVSERLPGAGRRK
jgi:hypothetical protein